MLQTTAEELFEEGGGLREAEWVFPTVDPHDVCHVIYTSGSTGAFRTLQHTI